MPEMNSAKMQSRLNRYTFFKVIACVIPAVMIITGVIFVSFPQVIESFGIKRLIVHGWYLIIMGLALYFIEVCYLYFFE